MRSYFSIFLSGLLALKSSLLAGLPNSSVGAENGSLSQTQCGALATTPRPPPPPVYRRIMMMTAARGTGVRPCNKVQGRIITGSLLGIYEK